MLKLYIYIILLILFSCKGRKEDVIGDKKEASLKIRTENRIFVVGDINGDKVNDTAFISYKINIETNEIECEAADHSISLKFKENIPDLKFYDTKGIVIKRTEDLNRDTSNEIVVFARTNQGWWNDVSIWSLKNNSWVMLAKTKAFMSEEKDFNNRIVKIDNHYYLIGDNQLEEDSNGNFDKIKIKIE
ncbi:MAG: hypothetical protein RSC81_11610 [Myroides sp.]